MKNITIPDLLEEQYKQFAYYVIESRAIPSVVDGLKPVQRRSLWTATKIAKNEKVKVVKLSGAVLSIHPHGSTSCDDAISNMAQRFAGTNNISYFDGYGAFGSKIMGSGNGIGASRYVSVKLSENFNKIMGVDLDLINKVPTYDDADLEPQNFLPIVPTVLLNPIQGIAVGFACDILPRKLSDIIHCQMQHLDGKGFREPSVYYEGFRGEIKRINDNAWQTIGVFSRTGKKINITELPVGSTRENYIKVLDNLEEKEIISSYIDDCTDDFNFTATLKVELKDEEIIEKFKLTNTLNENITVIGFDGKVRKMTFSEIITEFTDYRFGVYLKRYKKLFVQNKEEFEFKKDLYSIISKGLFKKFPELTKKEIKEFLIENSIQEKHIEKIVQIPIYKFGKEEFEKLKTDLQELKIYLENLVKLCKDEELRKNEYKKELKDIK
jgi:DNA gyrase/topoisomerase IV subunit A